MNTLDELEHHSIFLLRESYQAFKPLAMPWSMGKDSCVLLWLTMKAFAGEVPFPVVHIDTGYEFAPMLAFRDAMAARYQLDLRVHKNHRAIANGVGYATHDPLQVTHALKTEALQQAVSAHGWRGLVTGIRRDEDPTRAKERYFSVRNANFEWSYKNQRPEFWHYHPDTLEPGEHMRVHPLLDWTEIDIWRYIEREDITVASLYFAQNGERYRSIGCEPITRPVPSQATTVAGIIAELGHTRASERYGRTGDRHQADAMLTLRAKGFM